MKILVTAVLSIAWLFFWFWKQSRITDFEVEHRDEEGVRDEAYRRRWSLFLYTVIVMIAIVCLNKIIEDNL